MKKYVISLFIIVLGILSSSIVFAQKEQKLQSDNGDGTFTNPLIFADFPDPDIIQVDSVYYMVTTTMFIFPGVTLLKSYDLVNWEYCCNAIPRMDCSKCYNLDSCNRYHHGQWATSLKYHNGKYYMLFITLDEGGFICIASKPEGPWQMKKLPKGFHDPGLFFDEETNKIYVAYGYGTIRVTELDTSFAPIGKDVEVFKADIGNEKGLEGTHVYKINGFYYLYCTYGGMMGFQVALRSKNIFGPYEEKIVIRDTTGPAKTIHQGALVQTKTGEWWTILFVDEGSFGRMPFLQPVTWKDGWPIVGENGKGVVTYRKPNVGKTYPIKKWFNSDEFNSKTLGLQWGWNHNPDTANWTFTNKGTLRLTTSKVVTSLPEARNTLTQRIFSYYNNTPTIATTKMTTKNMMDGDVAGLAVFQDPYAFIGVKIISGKSYVVMDNNGKTIDSILINKPIIYLRAAALFSTNKSIFSYSTDNKKFFRIGNELEMQFNLSVFTGNKFCLFNYPTKFVGGFVDFDWFRTNEVSRK